MLDEFVRGGSEIARATNESMSKLQEGDRGFYGSGWVRTRLHMTCSGSRNSTQSRVKLGSLDLNLSLALLDSGRQGATGITLTTGERDWAERFLAERLQQPLSQFRNPQLGQALHAMEP